MMKCKYCEGWQNVMVEMSKAMEILKNDNVRLAAINDLLIEAHGTGAIPEDKITEYLKARRAGIDAAAEIDRQGMIENARLAGIDALGESSRKASDARHSKYRDAKAEILAIWASGKYETRKLCAEQEAEDLGIEIQTARKHLQGTPDPEPWPGKIGVKSDR